MRHLTAAAVLIVVGGAWWAIPAAQGDAPVPQPTLRDPVLDATIARLDAEVFDAFNAGDLERQKPYFDPGLEFYHDAAGFSDYRRFLEDSARLFEGPNRPHRTLVPGTLEVVPIHDYGAVQLGSHRFCQGPGSEDCATYRFIHIWHFANDEWKITRVISLDH